MTTLHWDNGTAYDLFVSLHILHRPADYGLRKAWAKGVRARLGQHDRDTLERITPMLSAPIGFLQEIPAPKGTIQVLQTLKETPADKRIGRLTMGAEVPEVVEKLLQEVADRGSYTESDVEFLVEKNDHRQSARQKRQDTIKTLDIWSNIAEFGDAYLQALTSYYKVFYAEEEERIQPVLLRAQSWAQELATKASLPDLIEELSQGVRVPDTLEATNLTLVPSFWITPLVLYGRHKANDMIMLFGARPTEMSLVPGDIVPDALHTALKALADPTRLRILRYLSQEPMTPAQLARKLRLRAPTVSHHLYTLRLARLVHLSFEDRDKRRYALRPGAIESTYQNLGSFLSQENADE